MTATCPQCEADDLIQGQHFCHHCGATLTHPTVPATANIVGDGDRPAWTYAGRGMLRWAGEHPGGVVSFGVSAVFVVAMVAFAVVAAVALVGMVVAAAVHALPFLLIALFIIGGHGGHRGGRGRRRSRARRNVYWV